MCHATNGASGPISSALCAPPCVREVVRCATSALVLPDLNARSVSLHLADISRQIAPGAHAVLVLDGAGFHIANDLEIPGNISLLRLPPYSPAPG